MVTLICNASVCGFFEICKVLSVNMSLKSKLSNVKDTSRVVTAFKICWSLDTYFVRRNPAWLQRFVASFDTFMAFCTV